ncbi:hypothetical protein BDY17DRAFT_93253 [Neohortaea acidophila]|uniref:Uncharacterized protein n=1 Tax=Neohortaea acidophila TaxID=245834 RepID=A0A6A6PY29_9PEZI|nr:uncharacterized protein BDY17DRAFT_93253 [Neohortaea acidophila]KAF2484892.1 hypothetical protein BDY17DRAFT_93253 [Neohortaea acidophila]
MKPSQLSAADAKILTQVFDPESGPAKAEVLVDPSLPQDRHVTTPELLAELRGREKAAIIMIEAHETSKEHTPAAKDQAYRQALSLLDEIVQQYPDYASARNNRAQLRRWRFGDRNTLCQRRTSRDLERAEAASSAVRDLQQAVSLASPARPQDAVSPAQGKLLAQAYTQLGALYLAASKDLAKSDFAIEDAELASWTHERFEEEASRSFYLGGLYGNEVAKALAVHTNPHAKLCGGIVKEAMRKEFAQVLA